jgi:hypothetical protein
VVVEVHRAAGCPCEGGLHTAKSCVMCTQYTEAHATTCSPQQQQQQQQQQRARLQTWQTPHDRHQAMRADGPCLQ